MVVEVKGIPKGYLDSVYVPYTGANASVNLGANALTANNLTDTALTSGRVVLAGTSGQLTDTSSFTYNKATETLQTTTSLGGYLNLFPEDVGGGDYYYTMQLSPTGTTYLQLDTATEGTNHVTTIYISGMDELSIYDTTKTFDIFHYYSSTGDLYFQNQGIHMSNLGVIAPQGYKSSDGSAGITTTITTASLVGKTITIKNGLITGFA